LDSNSDATKEPTQGLWRTKLSIGFECFLAVFFSAGIVIVSTTGLIVILAPAVFVAVATLAGGIAVTAIGILRDCRVLNAVRGLDQEQLCDLWDENLKIIRPSGERAANDRVVQAQLLPCALARRDRTLAQLRREGQHLGEKRLQEICDRCRQAFNNEWARQERLGFTCRMHYTSMDDFLFLMDYWAKRELGLVSSKFTGKRHDCLSFAGGGAKGVGYMPLFQLFFSSEASDIFEEDCRFTGSSAGALMAVCGAFGPHEVREPILEMQRACLKISSSLFLQKAYPSFSKRLGGGFVEGLGPVEVIDRYTSRQVRTFLQYVPVPDATLATLTDSERARLGQLRQPYDLSRNREPYMVRFSDIELLRKLPRGKEFFHLLSIALWNSERDKTVFASCETTSDFPVAYAARISMSLPFIFQRAHMAIPGLDSSDNPNHYYDGGIEQLAPDPGKAFGSNVVAKPFFCVLDGDGESYREKIQTSMIFSFTDRLLRMNSITSDLLSRRDENWKTIRGSHFLVTPHGTIDTLQFWFSGRAIAAAEHQSVLAAWRKIVEIRNGN
jgi:hypothetical protein